MTALSTRRSRRLAAILVAGATLPLLAGCSLGTSATLTHTAAPHPTVDTRTASPSAAPTGSPVNGGGSINTCNTISVATVAQVTGLKLTTAEAEDPDTYQGAGYTLYPCVFSVGSSSVSVVIDVAAGDVNQAFHDDSDTFKPTSGLGPIGGIGDRAEGDGTHVLDVLWGSRYVIQILDNSPGSTVGVANLKVLATDVHQKLGE